MFFEVLFLFLLIAGLCVIAYRGAVHEFQILQKDYDPSANWTEMMNEQLPIVIRNIPKHWLGSWTQTKTSQKTWEILVCDHDKKKFKTTWGAWLQTPNNTTPVNLQECATSAKLLTTFQHWQGDGVHQWYHLPVATPTPYVFQPTNHIGLRKVVSDFSIIAATDGLPLELWIAHEGAIPNNVKDDIVGKDPWIQTTDTIPWIGDVKYIEIKLRPGNAILLPRHWWYAIRASQDDPTSSFAWFWIGHLQTPMSWIATKIKNETS